MKSNTVLTLASIIAGAVLLASSGMAQPYITAPTKAAAIAAAKAQGKLIMTDFGRPGCSDCDTMKVNFNGGTLKPWLLEAYIVWDANWDSNGEAQYYGSGLGDFGLPLCVFIDPNNPSTWIGSQYTGLIPVFTFLGDVKPPAQTYLPILVSNHPGKPLTNATASPFTLKGTARTNALTSGAVVNVPITAVYCRLVSQGGVANSWQTATTTNKWATWSVAIALQNGTNSIESYVQYQDGRTSWTNRVPLVYLPPVGTTAQTITFNQSLPSQTYGAAAITLTATASSSLPVTYTVTSGPASVSGSTLTITGAGSVTVQANQSGNATYAAAPPVPRTFTVNPLPVSLTGSRTYNGTTAAAAGILTVANKIGADDVTVASGTSTLASGNPGTQTITSFGTLVLGGASAGNYVLAGGSGSVTITRLPVNLTGSRPFDGTTTAPAAILTVANRAGSDDVTVASGSGTLAGAGVGPQAITSLGTLALGGTASGNYTLSGASGTVTILAASSISVVISPTNKIVSVGDTAVFQANVTGGGGALTYRWYSITSNPVTGISSTNAIPGAAGAGATLTIANVSLSDAGGYQCTVSDGISSTTSAEAGLWIMPGTAQLYFGVGVYGPVDALCHLEYATNSHGPWLRVTNSSVKLSRSGQIVVDEQLPSKPLRIYRLVVP